MLITYSKIINLAHLDVKTGGFYKNTINLVELEEVRIVFEYFLIFHYIRIVSRQTFVVT